MLAEVLLAAMIDCVLPMPRCEQPRTRFDVPACEDAAFDDALIDAARHGDHSSIAMLQQRFDTAFTFAERFGIGGALLGRVADDGAIWRELSLHAENALSEEKAAAYVAEHDYVAHDYDYVAAEAFAAIAADRRARPLLLRALASDNPALLQNAIIGLAAQHDETSLPRIEEALQRVDWQSSFLAAHLALFKSEAADRLAVKYIKDDLDREYFDYLRCD